MSLIVEQNLDQGGRITIHANSISLPLTRADAVKLARFLFIALHNPDPNRKHPLGYDSKGQAILL